MPKTVDHEQRRREVADAFGRVVAREGFEGATVRAVAQEAGWSTGVLAHYFADKDELLAEAMRLIVARATERAGGDLRALLEAGLPLDARRREEARLWFALVGRALASPHLAAQLREYYTAGRQALVDAGAAEEDAGALIALVDGIAIQAVSDPKAWPARAQRAALDAALSRREGRG